jgi:hypothetical protein
MGFVKVDRIATAKASELPVICEVLRDPSDVSTRHWVRFEPCDIFGRPSVSKACLVRMSSLENGRFSLISPDKVFTYLIPDSLKNEETRLDLEFGLIDEGIIF